MEEKNGISWGQLGHIPNLMLLPLLSPQVWPPHQLYGRLHHSQSPEQNLLGEQIALGQDRT